MARPASRKAVSSLPAIANIDEQLDEVVMDLSKFITPVKADEVEYVIIGGRRDGERGVMDKSVHTINGDGIYHKKQITCGGYTATFFVSSDMGDATPGKVVSILCHGYRKPNELTIGR